MTMKKLEAKKKTNKTSLIKLKDRLRVSELELSELILIKLNHNKLVVTFSELFDSIYRISKKEEIRNFI